MDMIATGRGVERILRSEDKEILTLPQQENHMFYEAQAFAKQLKLGSIAPQMKQRSLTVAKVLTEVRRQTGVVFPADKVALN